MLSYEVAKAMAKASKEDWNEDERVSLAVITWTDGDYEYEAEIENDMEDSEFMDWIEQNAGELAEEDAAEHNTTCEEVIGIDYEYEAIDDDELFEDAYEAYAELEWECRTGR